MHVGTMQRLLLIVALAQFAIGPTLGHCQDRPHPPVELVVGDQPINLSYPEPTSVKEIYRRLGRDAGVNILFDIQLRDQLLHIELSQVTALQGLEMLTKAAGHIHKVVHVHTILIYEDIPVNHRPYATRPLVEDVELRVPSAPPVRLAYPEPTSVMEIYRRLGRDAGVNVVFERNLRDMQMTLELSEVTPLQGLEILMKTSRHFYRVVDDDTILIIADTPRNRRGFSASRKEGI